MKEKVLFVLVAILATLLGVSCAHATSPQVATSSVSYSVALHGDTRFTLEEREDCERAADAWGIFTNDHRQIFVLWDLDEATLTDHRYDARIVRVDALDARVTRVDEALPPNKHALGITIASRRPWVGVVMDRLAPGEFYPVVLHEFGHVLGLSDLPAAGVMSSAIQGNNGHFTPADRMECLHVGACVEDSDQ